MPRQARNGSTYGSERMRNQWLMIKLENSKPSNNKMVLRNAFVDAVY